MSATVYDILDYPGFQDLLARATKDISQDYAATIRDASRTGNFSLLVQVGANCDAECVEVMTLGELMDTKANEHGEQFIDCRAAEKVLFGKYGICKPSNGQPRRLALPIQVTFTKGSFDPLPHSPTISSGRHRLICLYMLLRAAGLSDQEIRSVKVRITSLVAPSIEDFAMVMEAANMSRTQSTHELDVHQMTSLKVQTNEVSAFYDSLPAVANRKGMHSKLFAQATRLAYKGQIGADRVYSAVKSAWTDVKGVDKENAVKLAAAFLPENLTKLQRHAEYLAGEVDRCYSAAIRETEQPGDINRILKENLARELAALLEATAPVYPTQVEVEKQRLEKLEAKAEALRAALAAAG